MKNRIRGKVKARVICAFVILLLLLLLLLRIFVFKNGREADISDYIRVEFQGLNTMGRANTELDGEHLYEQLSKGENDEQMKKDLKSLVDSIRIETEESDLSNDQNVTIVVTYDSDLLKRTKSHFYNTKYVKKVSGLSEGKQLDLFEKVKVTLSGASPEIKVEIQNQWEDEELKKITFHADKTAHITKGDVITVTSDSSRYDLEKLGYVIKAESKTYGTENANSYVKDVGELNPDILRDIKKEAMETIQTQTEDMTFRMLYKATNDTAFLFRDNQEKAEHTEFVKAVFLKKKPEAPETAEADNYIYEIFKSVITSGDQSMEVYFVFEYPNAMLNKENQFELGHADPNTRYQCSTNLETLISQQITTKENNYANQDITDLVK